MSGEIHVRPALRVGGRRRPPLSQRIVLSDECLESQIETVESFGSVGHETRLSSVAVPSCSIVHEGFAEMGKKGPRDALRRLRKEFRAIHAKGTAALRAGDYDALDEAINAERKLVDQQKSLVEAHLRLCRKR